MQVVTMGFMGMHEWMACLQQGTLVPGLGLELDQPNLHLAPNPLDDGLNLPQFKQKQAKTHQINHQANIHTILGEI